MTALVEAPAPPYVSLFDRLTALGETLNSHGGEIVPAGKTQTVLTALVHYLEHGDELLEQHEIGGPIPHPATGVAGGFARIEPILTPDRPVGWAPQVMQMDPKDLEIERLRAQLASMNAPVIDPRDAEMERLRAQLAVKNAAPVPSPAESEYAPTPASAGSDTAALVAEITRLQQEAARLGTENATQVDVVHDPEYTGSEYTRDVLKAESERRGLEPEGTGSDGYVTVEDYRGALIEDDKNRQNQEGNK